MEPFLFTCNGSVVGKAGSVEELAEEMSRLSSSYGECIQEQLSRGNISKWLKYMGDDSLASLLGNERDIYHAVEVIREFRGARFLKVLPPYVVTVSPSPRGEQYPI